MERHDEKIPNARVVSYEDLPVIIGKITFMDMWMVTDGENYGIRVRFKGPKRIVMDYLSGVGDVRSRTGHVVEQPDGTNIAQFVITIAGDKAIYNDKNWKKYTVKSIDNFFLPGTYKDDSINLISNPFK
ncbi:hypothetical protein D3C74_304660 [compost metagenome]